MKNHLKPIIHIINRTNLPADIMQQIMECQEPILLMNDGVYYLNNIAHKTIYIIGDDITARIPKYTISSNNIHMIKFIDLVTLATQYNLITW